MNAVFASAVFILYGKSAIMYAGMVNRNELTVPDSLIPGNRYSTIYSLRSGRQVYYICVQSDRYSTAAYIATGICLCSGQRVHYGLQP